MCLMSDFVLNGNELVSYCGSDTLVIVPEGVGCIGEEAFFGASFIQRIELPKSIERIGKRAFWGCAALESITLPCGLTAIEDNAFRECGALKEIVLPEGMTEIGEAVFRGCGQLERVYIPDSLSKLRISTFSDCFGLKEIRLSAFMQIVPARCFQWCVSLEEMQIPCDVREIDNEAFLGCLALKRVVLHEGLEVLGNKCFCECKKLTELEVPKSVKHIGADAFYKSGVIGECRDESLVLADILVKYTGSGEKVCVAQGVREVGDYAFAYRDELKEIHLPQSVTEIGDYAFERCSSLEAVMLPDGLESIGKGAFAECEKLAEITLPDSIEQIGSGAFEQSGAVFETKDELTCAQGKYLLSFTGNTDRLTIPDGVLVIADEAFIRCRVSEAVLPEGLKTIGENAFRWRSELKKANLPSSVKHIGANAFANCIDVQISAEQPCADLGENAFPSGTRLLINVNGKQIYATLEGRIRSGDCDEKRLWRFACDPSEETFEAIGNERYKLACAIAFYGCGEIYGSYLKENITQAVCFAAGRDTAELERVLSFGLLRLEQLRECIDFTLRSKLPQQQVILMRYRGEHFDTDEQAAKRFEL